jgi:hypothetical protein
MIQIHLQPEMEAQLAAEAQARGMALEHYIVEKLSGPQPTESNHRLSIENAIERIRQLRKGNRLEGLRITDLIDDGRKY